MGGGHNLPVKPDLVVPKKTLNESRIALEIGIDDEGFPSTAIIVTGVHPEGSSKRFPVYKRAEE